MSSRRIAAFQHPGGQRHCRRQSRHRCLRESGVDSRIKPQRGAGSFGPGKYRPRRDDDIQWSQAFGRRCVSDTGAPSQQSQRACRCTCATPAVQTATRRRRCLRQRFCGAHCALSPRNHRQRRYGQLTAVADLVGHRPWQSSAPIQNRSDRGSARCRRQSARSQHVGCRRSGAAAAVDQSRIARRAQAEQWIALVADAALKSSQIRALAQGGTLQLGLFDERNLFEFSHPDFPAERLMACRNVDLGKLRAHKREALLQATEKELGKIRARVENGALSGRDNIGVRVEGRQQVQGW